MRSNQPRDIPNTPAVETTEQIIDTACMECNQGGVGARDLAVILIAKGILQLRSYGWTEAEIAAQVAHTTATQPRSPVEKGTQS